MLQSKGRRTRPRRHRRASQTVIGRVCVHRTPAGGDRCRALEGSATVRHMTHRTPLVPLPHSAHSLWATLPKALLGRQHPTMPALPPCPACTRTLPADSRVANLPEALLGRQHTTVLVAHRQRSLHGAGNAVAVPPARVHLLQALGKSKGAGCVGWLLTHNVPGRYGMWIWPPPMYTLFQPLQVPSATTPCRPYSVRGLSPVPLAPAPSRPTGTRPPPQGPPSYIQPFPARSTAIPSTTPSPTKPSPTPCRTRPPAPHLRGVLALVVVAPRVLHLLLERALLVQHTQHARQTAAHQLLACTAHVRRRTQVCTATLQGGQDIGGHPVTTTSPPTGRLPLP